MAAIVISKATIEIKVEHLVDGVIGILDLMTVCGLTASKSEARRLIQQGGIFIDDSKVESIDFNISSEQLKDGVKIRKGKKTYHKVLLK